MAVLVGVMQSAIVGCLLVVLVSSVAIEIPSRIPTMPKFKGKAGGPYKCISIVSLSVTGSPVGFKIDNITTEKENCLITLISGGGSTDLVLCNGIPLAVRAVVYFYVEGIGWQYFPEFSRNDICPDVNIAPHSVEIAKKYSTGENEPHHPPWQPGHYVWTNVPGCIKLAMVPELPYRRIKGMGQLILNKTVIASGEREIIIGPDTGTEKDLREILENEDSDPNVLLPELNYTPFHAVAGSEDEDFAEAACRLFLIHNGNPNVKADEDLTPVHVAASWGHAKVLQVLLEGGGSPWLKDEVGKNAFDYAKESNDWSTMNVLSEFSQKNSENGNVMNILLSRMRNIRTSKKRGSRKGFGSAMKKEKSSTVPHLPTHFEESYETEEALIDNENIVDLTASDSEDFNSSKNSEYSICSENVEVIKEISTASSSGVSSPVPQSSSSELLSGLECSSVRTCTSGNKQPSSSHSSSLPDFVYSSSHVNTRKRHQETLNYGDETSQSSLSSSCSEMLIPENTRAFYESREWRTQGSSDVYNREGVPGSSREAKVLESTHSNTLPPRKSIARSSIMGLPKIPLITITEPCTLPDLTQERLAEYNSPRGVPNEHSYLSNRIQRWVNSVSHFSPLATSSEDTFYTCEDNSSVARRLNTAAFESGLHVEGTDNSLKSCATVSECYKYADEEKGVILLEERWLVNPVLLSDLTQTDQSTSSTAVLHTDTETIDTEHLVNELKSCGIDYGPVTSSTKKVYKLQLHKKKALNASFNHLPSAYSYELQRTLKDKKCMYFMSPGMRLEQVVAQQFAKPASGVNWREGNLKTSFTYLLLDPRITKNLPCRAASLQPKEVWSIFLQSIFYIGKGKRSRPYSHLYEAVECWKKGSLRYANAKVKRISEIWLEGLGVVCLHVFQNVIPVEAYTREAAMIDAIGVQNLCNMKRSEYYGKATQWYNYDRNIFGVYLLYRSLQIFLSEGERHLSPFDIM